MPSGVVYIKKQFEKINFDKLVSHFTTISVVVALIRVITLM